MILAAAEVLFFAARPRYLGSMLLRLSLLLSLSLLCPTEAGAEPAAKRAAAARRAAARRTVAARQAAAHRPAKLSIARSRRIARCRDIFCTAQVVRMDGSGEQKGLSPEEVEQLMATNRELLEPCLVEARRRDPQMLKVRLEFVVTSQGQVLASRVDGKRYSPLARCIHKSLRSIRFPRTTMRRTVAAVTLAVPQ